MSGRLRIFFTSLIALLAAVMRLSASEVLRGDFDAANVLYEQGRFAEAASAYENLIHSGRTSFALYFNLGNARFKSGEPGRALAAYRQAAQINPRDSDLRANLQFIRSQVQGPTLTPARWQRWLGRLTVNEWTGLAAVVFWVWLTALAVIQFRPGLKTTLRTFVWLSGIGVVVLTIGLGAALSVASAPSAVVVVREALVRNGPLEESNPSFTVHDGAELQVLDRKDDWLQVGLGDRRIGWLKRDQAIVFPIEQNAPTVVNPAPVSGNL